MVVAIFRLHRSPCEEQLHDVGKLEIYNKMNIYKYYFIIQWLKNHIQNFRLDLDLMGAFN